MKGQYTQKKCNHCQGDLPGAVASLATCTRCRARLCEACSRKYRFGGIGKHRGCPRSPKLQKNLWEPSEGFRALSSAFRTPLSCPTCGSAQSPRNLFPLEWSRQGGWGCSACASKLDLDLLRGRQRHAPSTTFTCGTWNIEKYSRTTTSQKLLLVPVVIANMLEETEADWLIVQEVTDAELFIHYVSTALARSGLGHYQFSGAEITLGSGGTKDHYVLIYNTRRVGIVRGPLHFGSSERPEAPSSVLFNRHRGGGQDGPVAGHRGSVGWLLSTLPYVSAGSLVWAMGIHTSPSGSTNKIPAQIHEIVTHAAKLRDDQIPVILAGDWYMQKDAPGYAIALQQTGWQIIASKYGTSLKHKNEEHSIQVADHLLVSDACEAHRVWQFVLMDGQGAVRDMRFRPSSMEFLDADANVVTNAEEFVKVGTPEELWQQLGAWIQAKIDHTPMFASFTIRFDEDRVVEVPGNPALSIKEWSIQIQSSTPTIQRQFSLTGRCPRCNGDLQPQVSEGRQLPGEFACLSCQILVTVPGGERAEVIRIL